MATSAYNKFEDFTEQLIRGVHDFEAHVFKVALTNTAPVATNTILGNITQIAAGSGYTTGGNTTTVTLSETSGTTTIQGTEVVFTATGAMGTFRYAVLYNDTPTSPVDPLIAWFDYGSAISLSNGETFTVRFNNASPGTIATLA
jgi:hypothetical protein